MMWRRTLALLALGLAGLTAQAQQGVTKDEIVIGTIQDLSGPLAGYGKQARNGMLLRVEESNEKSGPYGRRLKLLVEDSGYDPARAAQAARKLVEQDRIFALLGHLGTAQNLAAMPVLFERNVVNFLPLTGARDMFEPVHRLKYALLSPYDEQMRLGVPALVREKKIERVCALVQDDSFGQEVLRGAEAGLRSLGMALIEKATFPRGATDFSAQVARLKTAGCEMVVLGTIIRETIGSMAEARRTGFNPVFLGTVAVYSDLIHKLGGAGMDGLYATMTQQTPYLDEADLTIRFWADKYMRRFGEEPSIFSVYGYTIVDMFIKGVRKAGPALSTDSFVTAMDLSVFPTDSFGSPKMQFGPTRRLGSHAARLSQIRDGRWRVVSGYVGEGVVPQAVQGQP